MTLRRSTEWVPAFGVLIAFIALWEGIVKGAHIKRFLLPAPDAIPTWSHGSTRVSGRNAYRSTNGASHVAWVYPEPKAGYEQIKGRYGFYAGKRGGTEEVSA